MLVNWPSCFFKYHHHGLSFTHGIPCFGNLGITKMHDRVLKPLFLLVSCICQVTGKPNQVISPAALCPIRVSGEPFETVIVWSVSGPFPKQIQGICFSSLLREPLPGFQKPFPSTTLLAPVDTKTLIELISTFGLLKVVQTDQGNHFESKVFAWVLKALGRL